MTRGASRRPPGPRRRRRCGTARRPYAGALGERRSLLDLLVERHDGTQVVRCGVLQQRGLQQRQAPAPLRLLGFPEGGGGVGSRGRRSGAGTPKAPRRPRRPRASTRSGRAAGRGGPAGPPAAPIPAPYSAPPSPTALSGRRSRRVCRPPRPRSERRTAHLRRGRPKSFPGALLLGQLELLAGRYLVGVGELVEGGDLAPAVAVTELAGGDGPQGVALLHRVRGAVRRARTAG